ncbi:MAG: hypothetical protein K2O08_03320 [Clostridia bacterium]|nr:hypothetical protein [Clostridia bacterium]
MAKNKKRKKFAVSRRYAYHNKRLNDRNISENKRIYSKQWIDGYNDPYVKTNYDAVCDEIQRSKGKISRNYSIVLNGYKNGLKARLKEK